MLARRMGSLTVMKWPRLINKLSVMSSYEAREELCRSKLVKGSQNDGDSLQRLCKSLHEQISVKQFQFKDYYYVNKFQLSNYSSEITTT